MKTSENQIPILRFLNKHKWRIILPFIFFLFYFAIPRYQAKDIAVQQELFIKSSVLSQYELTAQVDSVKKQIYSESFLRNLIVKYDLYKTERNTGSNEIDLFKKLQRAINMDLREHEELIEGEAVFIWIYFTEEENSIHIAEIANEIAAQFEKIPNTNTDKYVTKPYDANSYRNWVFWGNLMQSLIFVSLPLILIWELPNLFYSPKTKKMVFEPLFSDWQSEIENARLQNQTFKAFQINVRYTYAFLAAMWMKSPIGDLIEFVMKIVKTAKP